MTATIEQAQAQGSAARRPAIRSNRRRAFAPRGVRGAPSPHEWWVQADDLTAPRPDDPSPDLLTPLEHQIVRLLCEGLPRDAIAERLGYSRSTLDKAISDLYAGTGFARAYQLVAWAFRCGVWRGK